MTGDPESWFAPHRPRLAAARHLYVAFSGGLDSTALLHGAATRLGVEGLTAIHVDHQLSPNSEAWRQHCQDVCAELGVGLIARTVQVAVRGEGVEQAARRARYQVFAELVAAGELLLMAHHQDDQLETIVYRLMRGAGPKGLAGMPVSRAIGGGALLRPLLGVPRAGLLAYAEAHGLRWVEDESNGNLAFDRNFLRHDLIPRLAARWPDYRQRLLRTASQCGSAGGALHELALADLQLVGECPERLGWSLDIGALLALSRERQLNLLSEWLALRGIAGGGHRVFGEVLDTLLPARGDANPRVAVRGGEFRRFQGRLHLLPPLPPAPSVAHSLTPLPDATRLADGGELRPQRRRGSCALVLRPGDRVTVAFRRGGERCRPAGRSGSAPLKKLLNEYRVPPWLRERLPLILVNGQLAAVADLFVCAEFCAQDGEEGWSFVWQPGGGEKMGHSD